MPGTTAADTQRKIRTARLSIYSNSSLILLKVVAGTVTGSVSVLAEAAHSANDLVAAFIAYFSVRKADAPPDDSHPFGHGKIENLSGLAEALLIFGAAAYIVYESIRKIHEVFHGATIERTYWAIAVMTVSAVVNVVVSRRLFAVAHETESMALEADAQHLQVDVYTSGAVVVGLTVAELTQIWLLDPILALLVAGLICGAAYRLSAGAITFLMDTGLPPGELEELRQVLLADPRVRSYHNLRTRRSGSHRYADVHIQLADDLSFVEAHRLTEELEDRLRAALPRLHVIVHPEPFQAERQHQRDQHGAEEP